MPGQRSQHSVQVVLTHLPPAHACGASQASFGWACAEHRGLEKNGLTSVTCPEGHWSWTGGEGVQSALGMRLRAASGRASGEPQPAWPRRMGKHRRREPSFDSGQDELARSAEGQVAYVGLGQGYQEPLELRRELESTSQRLPEGVPGGLEHLCPCRAQAARGV